MATLLLPSPAPSPALPRIGVGEYHAMIASGRLGEDDRVELLEGLLVPKMPKNPPHEGSIRALQKILDRLIGPDWDTRAQASITLADSEPEPDLAIVRADADEYFHRHPGPVDIGIVIEVADSSLEDDRELKQRVYARAKIPEYWIVNLVDGCVEVYTLPAGRKNARYGRKAVFGRGSTFELNLEGQPRGSIAVSAILPRGPQLP